MNNIDRYSQTYRDGLHRAKKKYPDQSDVFHTEFAEAFASASSGERSRFREALTNRHAFGRHDLVFELLDRGLDADEVIAVIKSQPKRLAVSQGSLQ